jgi:SAM-dependent MidA family methyltransferase
MSLRDEITKKIAKEGAISFRDFMEMCLYHPVWGYYRRRESAARDYRTSPEVSPLFAKYLGKQIGEMCELADTNEVLIAELGGGDLTLSIGILEYIETAWSDSPGDLGYYVLEHKERVGSAVPKDRIGVVASIEEIPFESSVFAIVFSNEFFDSLPVHSVTQTEEGLREVFVTESEGRLRETLQPLSSPKLADYFGFIGVQLPPGFRTEVNLEAGRIIGSIGRRMRRGFVITIDYGFPSHEIYSPARSCGTMVAYYRHRKSENVLIHPGEMDITSHINFSALAEWGRRNGLDITGFTDQGNLLISLGILDETESESSIRDFAGSFERNRLIKELISPDAMGEAFKVLIQYKGFELKPELTGLSRPPYRRWRL